METNSNSTNSHNKIIENIERKQNNNTPNDSTIKIIENRLDPKEELKRLNKRLASLEKEIYHLESSYLEENSNLNHFLEYCVNHNINLRSQK